MATQATTAVPTRQIVYRSTGHRRGPITRLISPGDLGEMVKPFIFLDLFEADNFAGAGFAPHPHSGIATVTLFLEGKVTYADSTSKRGALEAGAVEWMRAGAGVWHAGNPIPGHTMRGYQLWLALPPEFELGEPESIYLEPGRIESVGNVRVILGSYAGKTSPLNAPAPLTYLHVRLKDGERWTYQPEASHDIAWLALNTGRLWVDDTPLAREIAVFAEGNAPIEVVAEGVVELVVASAAKHPYPLVTGYYSVHTNLAALAEGERTIAALERTPAVSELRAII